MNKYGNGDKISNRYDVVDLLNAGHTISISGEFKKNIKNPALSKKKFKEKISAESFNILIPGTLALEDVDEFLEAKYYSKGVYKRIKFTLIMTPLYEDKRAIIQEKLNELKEIQNRIEKERKALNKLSYQLRRNNIDNIRKEDQEIVENLLGKNFLNN
jgi:hypothetical protein